MFSHGRSLTGLLIVFFALLFVPVVGPFLALIVLAAGGSAMTSRKLTPKERRRAVEIHERNKAEWHAGKAGIEAKARRKT